MRPGQTTYHNVFESHQDPGSQIIGAPYGTSFQRNNATRIYPKWVKVLYRINVRWK